MLGKVESGGGPMYMNSQHYDDYPYRALLSDIVDAVFFYGFTMLR